MIVTKLPEWVSFERREHGRLECDFCEATFDDSPSGADDLYAHACVFEVSDDEAVAAANALVKDEPLQIVIRVFEADRGWRWEIKVWRGDVDVMHTPPADLVAARRPFATRTLAVHHSLVAADRMVTP